MGTAPPIEFPRRYNAALEFIDRNVVEGRGDKTAVIDDRGSHSYAELRDRVNRAGNAMRSLGVRIEERVAICLFDSIDFPALFFGAMKIGAVPVPLNTLLTPKDCDYILRDCRARLLFVSEELRGSFASAIEDAPFLETVIACGSEARGRDDLEGRMEAASAELPAEDTCSDDVAFWLYTSGSTGAPKGAVHLHRGLAVTATLYGQGILGLSSDDRVFSAAKSYFAYGLGNSLSLPFHVGATSLLMAERPTPEAVMRVQREHEPTVFFGVPTLYASILADPSCRAFRASPRLRRCVSAGEALPVGVAKAWETRFGVPILDGLGSTEMLHIFLSNRPGDTRLGTSGKVVPGYEVRLLDESGDEVAAGELGELWVKGPSSAAGYWNLREKSLDTFHGRWMRTGDTYRVDDDGYYLCCGRTDDMLKVSGLWVSPSEVEAALLSHESVREVAVVGQQDDRGLVKPKAFIVLGEGVGGTAALVKELQSFVKDHLAPHKYPRFIDFVAQLPRTATGKIQRFRLRESAETR